MKGNMKGVMARNMKRNMKGNMKKVMARNIEGNMKGKHEGKT